MSFQLRHKDYGIYQGSFLGLGFWHPMSEMPEQGLCMFKTYDDAMNYKNFLCSSDCSALDINGVAAISNQFSSEDLTIEVYDEALNDWLINSAELKVADQ